LVGALKSELGSDSLLAEPIVYTLDEGTLSRYERRVLVRCADDACARLAPYA
jgi:hypothetical protein